MADLDETPDARRKHVHLPLPHSHSCEPGHRACTAKCSKTRVICRRHDDCQRLPARRAIPGRALLLETRSNAMWDIVDMSDSRASAVDRPCELDMSDGRGIAVDCRWPGRLEEAAFTWSQQGEVFPQHDAWLRNMDMSKCGLASLQAASVPHASFMADLNNAKVQWPHLAVVRMTVVHEMHVPTVTCMFSLSSQSLDRHER